MKRLTWSPLSFSVFSVVALLFAAADGCQGPETFLRSDASTGAGGDHIDDTGIGGIGIGGAPEGTGGRGTGGQGAGGLAGGTGGAGTGGRGTGGVTTGTGGLPTGTGGDSGGTGGASDGGAGGASDGGTGAGGMGAGGAGMGGRGTGGLGSGNCIDDLIGAGYSEPSVDPCSACHDNETKLADKCMAMIDCLETVWPCAASANCWTECRNKAGGSGILETCVHNLTAAACM